MLREAVRAAEEAESYREALTILGSLVELLPAGDPRWADVVDALSWEAQWVVNHRADTHAVYGIPALRAMDQALSGLGDPARRAAVKFRLATFLGWGTGELDEARQVCEEAQRLFEEAGERGALLARHELAWLDYLSGGLPEAEEATRQLVLDAEAIGDQMVRSRALTTLLALLVASCRLEEAEALLTELAAEARREGNRHRLYLVQFYASICLILRGRCEEGRKTLKDAGRLSTAVGEAPRVEFELLIAAPFSGDFRWALGRIRETGVLAGDFSRQGALALSVGSLAATEMGELGEARRYLTRAKAVYADRPWGFQSDMALHAEAALAWREGRTDDALQILRRVTSRLMAMEAWTMAIRPLVELAELTGRQGQPDPAAGAGLTAIADRTGLACHRALIELASAWSSFGTGDRSATRVSAARAAELLSTVDWPFFLAQAQALVGLVTDDREEARAALRSAAEIFERCGAMWRRSEAVEALGRLGSAGKRAAASVSGPGSLTGREREVAALAAAGLSAKEIGERLFIGERTVESHLARAYAKLGVKSKVDLARRAAEFDLLPEF